MFKKQTIRDIDVKGKNVLVRTDYNVPLKGVKITDDLRISASIPTINTLFENGAKKVILMSHLGRPDGQRVATLSLAPVAKRLQKLLPKKKVQFVEEVSGPKVEEAIEKLPEGGILLLENLRFWEGEEGNSADFARDIVKSTKAEVFVQDGFAVIHRAHASTSAITDIIPGVAGLLVEKEVSVLTSVMEAPEHPLVVVIGGAKVADKQPLIDRFSPIADKVIVGGKIAADGYKAENDKTYVAEDFKENKEGLKLDIGPLSTRKIVDIAKTAKTIVWNGALGKVEEKGYANASVALAANIGQNKNITSVICGGDTTGFVENLQKTHPELNYSLISTGGGASLELLSGLKLPGLESLQDK